jgi:pyrroloquinoline quinone biosynthesis protein B
VARRRIAIDAEGPLIEVRVLGTAQDGGVPQLGCRCRHCTQARRDVDRARRVASIGIVDDRAERRYLVEATPDLPEQWEELIDAGTPLHADGLFLTHAHSGHYAGLLHLGKEAAEVWGLPLHVTTRMASFLRANAPWSALVEARMVSLRTMVPDQPIELTPDLAVIPFAVPHRAEYTDTVALEVRGPEGSLVYVTDTDSWAPWERQLRARCSRARYALLDATFFNASELPGRDLSVVPHPFVEENLDLLAELAKTTRVYLTHLNHSNPLLDPGSPERERIHEAGLEVAEDGMTLSLGGERAADSHD